LEGVGVDIGAKILGSKAFRTLLEPVLFSFVVGRTGTLPYFKGGFEGEGEFVLGSGDEGFRGAYGTGGSGNAAGISLSTSILPSSIYIPV
jgi:hypothetical protein